MVSGAPSPRPQPVRASAATSAAAPAGSTPSRDWIAALARRMLRAASFSFEYWSTPALIDWKARRAELRSFLAHTPFRLDLDARPSELAAGEKQKLELLKQLYLKPRLLILDEPTSVLTPQEADEVLGHVREFARSGQCTVLIITHTLTVTTWGDRKVGDKLNLEVDLMARYAARLLLSANLLISRSQSTELATATESPQSLPGPDVIGRVPGTTTAPPSLPFAMPAGVVRSRSP